MVQSTLKSGIRSVPLNAAAISLVACSATPSISAWMHGACFRRMLSRNTMLLMALRVGHALAGEITDVFETEDCDFN